MNQEAYEGWKEATIAWAVCASMHEEYCKGRDPFFTTRQSDFKRHEEDARRKLLSLRIKVVPALDFTDSKPICDCECHRVPGVMHFMECCGRPPKF